MGLAFDITATKLRPALTLVFTCTMRSPFFVWEGRQGLRSRDRPRLPSLFSIDPEHDTRTPALSAGLAGDGPSQPEDLLTVVVKCKS
jgi:hypothetical protein